jgi:hypothetical protein
MTKQVVLGDKPELIGMSYLNDSQQGRVISTAVKTRSVGVSNGERAIEAIGITVATMSATRAFLDAGRFGRGRITL